MTSTLRILRLDAERWRRVGPDSWWSAAATVLVAAVLLMLIRFGGLVGDAPRAALRLTLVTVWGWIGLSLGIAAVVALQSSRADLRVVTAVVGLAHVPLLGLATATLVLGGMMEILGPGRVVAVIALVAWIPASLVVGVSVTCAMPPGRAAATIAAPYIAWLVLPVRHVLGQVEHLL